MSALKAIVTNIFALVCAAIVGFIAIDIGVYILNMPVGAVRISPLFSGFLATIIVAIAAPRSNFKVRFFAFAAIYLLDLALSVNAAVIFRFVINSYFGGDHEAAKPWGNAGALIPFVAGSIGYLMIRRLASSQPVGM